MRRDGTLFTPGLHENVSTWDDLQNQHNIVRQSGTECLYDKEAGTKNVLAKFFLHINETGQIRDKYMHGEIPFNLPPPI